MVFELSIDIQRSPKDVFGFLRDKDHYPQQPGSPVLLLEKTTAGPVGVGTQYREIVQVLPFMRGQIRSEITHFEPGVRLEETFAGAGMTGHLAYWFHPQNGGTRLVQHETIRPQGFMRLLEPVIKRMLARQLWRRLEAIKAVLESGWAIAEQGESSTKT
jgi:hypothetical protein